MKKLGILTLMLLIASAIVFTAGCIGGDPIVGTWQSGSSDTVLYTLILNSDGTGTVQPSSTYLGFEGKLEPLTWKKVSDGTYSISSSIAYLRDGVLYYQLTPFIKV